MGCEHGMYLATLDERVAFAILSCCVREWREEVHDALHCGCSYVPDLFRYFDWPDVTCLIAPRPVLVQQGLADDVSMDLVEGAVSRIRNAYGLLDAAESVVTDFFEGGHQFNFTGAARWLAKTVPVRNHSV
jgi:hypothetical protein